MLETVEVEAKTLEDAVAEALARLGARREEVEIETLAEPRPGFLGIGASPAKVRVTRKADPAAAAVQALRDVLAACEIPGAVTGEWDEEYGGARLNLEVSEDDSAILVGRRGQTLNAFQYLASVIAGRRVGQRVRVVLDVDGFRERRAESLEGLARRAAREAIASGLPVDIDPMPPQDRRIIHLYLQSEKGIECHSEGEGRHRHIVITPSGGEGRARRGGRDDDRPRGREGGRDSSRRSDRDGRRGGRGRRSSRSDDRSERRTGSRRDDEGSGRRDERPDDGFVPPTDAAVEWVKPKKPPR